jgi:hypothetical protein
LAEAASLLTALAGRGVPFVVLGSLARQWLSAEAPARPPHDVDILVSNEIDSLNRLVQSLIEYGFAVHSWDEPVRPPVDPYRLQGRFYLRAVRVSKTGSRLVLDATYESACLPFEEAWRRRINRGAIAVASPDDLDRFQWPRSPANVLPLTGRTTGNGQAFRA